ncbi:DDE-type integrase/transposase/recombinase [Parvibium lacunae]|uniref:DDE-type integrase/transposase/recombinase n=1 Tax=Parvibium lacunae TaxID=1888893 RepID=UPI003B82C6A4
MGRRIQTQLVREAFEMAMLRHGNPKGVIFHSDQGSQYASREFRLQLAQHTAEHERRYNTLRPHSFNRHLPPNKGAVTLAKQSKPFILNYG